MEIAMSKISKVCAEAEIWPPPCRPRGQNPHLGVAYGRMTWPIGVIEPEWKFSQTGNIWKMNVEPSITTNVHLEAKISPLPWKLRKIRSAALRPFTKNFQWVMLGSWLKIDLDWGITVHLQQFNNKKVCDFTSRKQIVLKLFNQYASGGGGRFREAIRTKKSRFGT